MKKILITIVATVLVCACIVGGTVAWLMDSTEAIENTFTIGNINIELEESDDLDLKMVPGAEITKDPTVTVVGGSEACWLFVTVEKSDNFDDFMTYEMDDKWKLLETGVYYMSVVASDSDQEFQVIKNDTVTVSQDVTKDDADGIAGGTIDAPTLTFTAYAIQQSGFEDEANIENAWDAIQDDINSAP